MTEEKIGGRRFVGAPNAGGNGSDGASPSSKEKMSKTAREALECLRNAVRDELVKKAKLGQDVIINCKGQPYKISAAEALRIREEGTQCGNEKAE